MATPASKASSAALRAPTGRLAALIGMTWNISENTAKSRTATTIRDLRVRSRPQMREIAIAAASGVKIPILRQSNVWATATILVRGPAPKSYHGDRLVAARAETNVRRG